MRRSGGFGLCDPIYQIHQPVVVDTAMLSQANFARTAGGNAFTAVLHGVLESAQRVGIQLRSSKAFIARKAAAMDAFGDDHVDAAQPRQFDQRLAFAQMLGAARHVDCDGFLLRGEGQFVQQVRADKTHGVV